MAKIYESIMLLVKPEVIAMAATTLNETEQKVSAGVDIILPSLLARALKKGDTPEIRNIIEEAGKLRMHEEYGRIWEGDGIFDGKNIGVRLENQLIGVENPRFYATAAARSGLQKEHTNRLTNWIAGTIAAYLGEKAAQGRLYVDMLADLAIEREELRRDIPSTVVDELGLASTLGITEKNTAITDTKKKKSSEWLLWLALIILITMVLLWWRSCDRKKKTEELLVVTEQVVEVPQAAEPEVKMPIEKKRTLDGQPVTVCKDAMSCNIKAYLDSNKFNNATEAQRKTVWFEFPGIGFEHNSATDLTAGAEKQVQELASLLKNYPDVKVLVGAFADKTGTNALNFAISEKRAANIATAFEKAGIDKKRISTEGFGEGYAEVAESADDAKRAPDRDIALRFTK